MTRFPPPIWTLAYLLMAAGLSHLLGWPRLPGLPLIPLGIGLIILGVALAVSAARLFRRLGTELNPTSATNRKLVVSGPFRFTRNPMYLGLILTTAGIAFAVGVWPMFLVPFAVFATVSLAHIPFEEAKMRRQFGAAYEAYAQKVRRWI